MMKQCPKCLEVFDDQQRFCDLDGAELSDQEESLRVSLVNSEAGLPEGNRDGASSAWLIGGAGVVAGIALCSLFYLALPVSTRKPDDSGRDNHRLQSRETAPPRSNQMAAAPAQLASPDPLETAEASPESDGQTNSPASVSTPATPAPRPSANLNEQPISTGQKVKAENNRAVIVMKDGSSVEADAAWQDSQGVWYRRSGLVSFIEYSRVEKVTEPAQPRPAAEAPKP